MHSQARPLVSAWEDDGVSHEVSTRSWHQPRMAHGRALMAKLREDMCTDPLEDSTAKQSRECRVEAACRQSVAVAGPDHAVHRREKGDSWITSTVAGK
mmetsp:Transcript_12058/g.28313  ORF Transcript_12058/g.28313 Transcript_12058/m.28313 type:complete len:98 (-) Transcript_12058:72-365(-)